VSRAFVSGFKDIIRLLQDNDAKSCHSALERIEAFLESVCISIISLKGLDGIHAMCTFLNVLVLLWENMIEQK